MGAISMKQIFILVWVGSVKSAEWYDEPEHHSDSHNHGGGPFLPGKGLGGYGGHGGFRGAGNPLMAEAMYGNPNVNVAGGNLHLGNNGIKNPLNLITNAAYQNYFTPMKTFGMGGFGGMQNPGHEVNKYRHYHGQYQINPDDLDQNGVDDHLEATKHKIDEYLAKQWKLGKRKLTVNVQYGNMPLEYQFLEQYHGFPNPVAGTPLGAKFGMSNEFNNYNNPLTKSFSMKGMGAGFGPSVGAQDKAGFGLAGPMGGPSGGHGGFGGFGGRSSGFVNGMRGQQLGGFGGQHQQGGFGSQRHGRFGGQHQQGGFGGHQQGGFGGHQQVGFGGQHQQGGFGGQHQQGGFGGQHQQGGFGGQQSGRFGIEERGGFGGQDFGGQDMGVYGGQDMGVYGGQDMGVYGGQDMGGFGGQDVHVGGNVDVGGDNSMGSVQFPNMATEASGGDAVPFDPNTTKK